ncbi:MAG: DUF551 domain-containing protein [Oscillospiraceae bacterium]|nr:DUF551 domain-containing protein [Oscillospiraceae bacterium]
MDVKEKLVELLNHEFGKKVSEITADWLIANGVTVQEWIPVSERLPEIGVPVLVTYRNFNDGTPQSDGVAAQLFGEGCWYWWEGCAEDCDTEVLVEITHWMPLPEPLKMAGGAADDAES